MRTARDEGNTHVLEAVIIASIMVSAVAFVVTYETPPTGTTNARNTLQTKADDALKILYDTPYPGSTFGDNALSVYLAECMQGVCTNLTTKLKKLLPPGGSYAIYISNGYETFPVYVEDTPSGEAVTATHLLEPNWSSSFVATTRNNVNPNADPLTVYSLPIFNSNVISQDGSPLLVKVNGRRQSDGSSFVLTTYATTEQVAAANAQLTPAVSLTFLVPQRNADTNVIESWVPGAAGDWTPETYSTASQNVTLQNATFLVHLNETANVDVLAGTELTVHLPRGWTGSASQAAQNGDWLVLSNVTDWNGTQGASDITARLLNNVKARATNFTFNAIYRGDHLNYYPFEASLSRGVYAHANLIAKADAHASSTQTYRAPAVRLSAPAPMGSTATTTWSASIDIPFISGTNVNLKKGTANPASTYIMIESIEILEINGKNIFPSTVTTTHYGVDGKTTNVSKGTWASVGDKITWTPTTTTTSESGPISLTFRMAGNATESARSMRPNLIPPVKYSTDTGRLISLGAPGLHRGESLPSGTVNWNSYSGYATTGSNNSVRSDAVYRSTALLGGWKYNASNIPSVGGALYGSYVQVDKRSVPVGGQVVLTADVQSMLFALADAGSKTEVSVKFYPPWAGESRKDIWNVTSLDSGLFSTEVLTLMTLDLNGDGWPDPIMGTSNGRVIAVDGLSGSRMNGLTYIPPAGANVSQGNTVIKVTALGTLRIGSDDYIVVGTNGASGVHVLDKTFNRVWTYDKTPKMTVSFDTSADVDGDARNDIVMITQGSNSPTFGVFVLRALAGDPVLQPWVPINTTINEAFYVGSGEPGALTGLSGIGPTNAVGGVAVSMRTLPGQKQFIEYTSGDPTQPHIDSKIVIETPRYGLAGIARDGTESWVSFGSPISAVERFNHDNDSGTDVIAGSPNGYVYMMNGTMAGQQIFSTNPLWPTQLAVRDADGTDFLHQAYVTLDGRIFYTTNGWNSAKSMAGDPITASIGQFPDAQAIALNGTATVWLAGKANGLWYTANPTVLEDPNYPTISKAATIVAVGTDPTTGLPSSFDFTTKLHDFNDIECGFGATGNNCWVVSGPCIIGCNESLVMRTTNSGLSWTILRGHANITGSIGMRDADNSWVGANLTRVKLSGPADEYGWITGWDGTLLRSLDAGATWRGINTGTTVNFNDIACTWDGSTCLAVADGGYAYRIRSATGTPEIDNLTSRLGVTSSIRDLLTAGISNETWYIGVHNALLKSLDGGDSWTVTPMNYLQSDVGRIVVHPDGRGFAYGGNESAPRIFTLHDFKTTSQFYTKKLNLPVPEGAKITFVSAKVEGVPSVSANYTVSASSNGGTNWQNLTWMNVYKEKRYENGMLVAFAETEYNSTFTTGQQGTDLRLRFNLSTSPTTAHQSAYLQRLFVNYTWDDGTSNGNVTVSVVIGDEAARATYLDQANTTSVWNATLAAVHTPSVPDGWVRNLSGEVTDIVSGYNVVSDWRDDVWVATGQVLAGNSPEYALYAQSNESLVVGTDYRIYLLDGKNGTIVANTSELRGKPEEIAIVDRDLNGVPDMLMALVVAQTSAKAYVMGFDPTTLVKTMEREVGASAYDMALGRGPGPYGRAYTSISGGTTGVITASRMVTVNETNVTEWTSFPDDRGKYTISKDIPENWLFGPYVVELAVAWTERTNVGNVTSDVLQSATFYDYFLVTPPGALSPPSPLYNVELQTWMRDWS